MQAWVTRLKKAVMHMGPSCANICRQRTSFRRTITMSAAAAAEDWGGGRHEAESVAGGPDALPLGPAATASKGSNGEVSSGVHPAFTTSDDTFSCEPSLSEGDVEPQQLPDGQARVPVVVGVLKGWYHVQVSSPPLLKSLQLVCAGTGG
jgi:hypothetical protein